ncbi:MULTISPECIES: ABC transporter substrate-binding protein [unclassified Aureimonas]|uniref:ABC transporter substrate-binding protein n=1 Tax=unclassified Aureimonas TaxID=2615206 RepID=UPI0006FDB05A|nr:MULTISPECIES: ABC transporter substrate-binding protein [unclassified Aureimonas]KQT62935.1 ABC transporter substrate-binding protein [Aureimonas sp. Leaf427]KQT74828.1 ABC transporter substrate-binding protein [Aureimonas sp. Leaf460]
MRWSWKNALLAGVGMAAVAMTAGLSAAQEAEPIKVGFAIALSGWMAAYDEEPYNAARLKIEEINKAGGLLGRQIEYQVIDTKTDPTLAVNSASGLVDWGADLMIVSGDYDTGSPAAFVAQNAQTTAISFGASDPKMGVQGVGPYVFSAHTAGQAAGIVMAEYAFKELGFKNAFMLEDVTMEATKSSCAGFAAAWKNAGGTLLGRDTFQGKDPSIAVQITGIKGLAQKPDFIFMCSSLPEGPIAVRQLRAAQVDMPILADTGMSGDYWLGGVPGLKDFYVPTLMSITQPDPRKEINDFLAAYKARWEKLPTTEFSVLGFCTIEQWTRAAERAKSVETEAVVAVMNQFKDEPLTCGPTTYNDQTHIQVSRPQLIMKVEDGSFRPQGVFQNEFVPDLNLLLRSGQ